MPASPATATATSTTTSAAGATSAEARDEGGQAGMGGGMADEQWSVYLASKAAALRSELEQAPTPSRSPRPHPQH